MNYKDRAIEEISYYFGLKNFKQEYFSESTETWEFSAVDERTNKEVLVEFSIVPLMQSVKFLCDSKWNKVDMMLNVHIENADMLINRCLFVGKRFNDIYGKYLFSDVVELTLKEE